MSFVATNLTHQQLWTDVTVFEKDGYTFCEGVPPQKLHPDDPEPIEKETVLVSRTSQQWTIADWKKVFDSVNRRRITMAMVTSDSTVVYYLVYRGLQVPRKN